MMNTMTWLLVGVLVLASPHSLLAKPSCNVDVVLVLDTSGSICGNGPETCSNLDKIGEFAEHIIEKLQAKEADTEIAIVQFSSKANVRQGFTKDTGLLYDALSSLRSRGSTVTKLAIETAHQLFTDRANKDRDAVLVLVTDGMPNDNQGDRPAYLRLTIQAADDAMTDGIQFIAIGVLGSDFTESTVQRLSSAPRLKNDNYFVANSFDGLDEMMANSIAASSCEKPKVLNCKLDLVILFDASGSICGNSAETCDNLSLQKGFVKQLANNFLEAPNSDNQAALISFGSQSEVLSDFSTSVEELDSAVDSLKSQGMTVTKAAVQDARKLFESPLDRVDGVNVVILVTDGTPNDNSKPRQNYIDATIAEIEAAAEAENIYFVVVGVTGGSDFTEENVASLATASQGSEAVLNTDYFLADDFVDLDKDLVEQVVGDVCTTSKRKREMLLMDRYLSTEEMEQVLMRRLVQEKREQEEEEEQRQRDLELRRKVLSLVTRLEKEEREEKEREEEFEERDAEEENMKRLFRTTLRKRTWLRK